MSDKITTDTAAAADICGVLSMYAPGTVQSPLHTLIYFNCSKNLMSCEVHIIIYPHFTNE